MDSSEALYRLVGLDLCMVPLLSVLLPVGLNLGLASWPYAAAIFSLGSTAGLIYNARYRRDFAALVTVLVVSAGTLAISGIAWGFDFGLAAMLLSFLIWSRAYYFPLHLVLLGLNWMHGQSRYYGLHPATIDDCCLFPFTGLNRLLLASSGTGDVASRAEIDRLIDHYPSQRGEALKARTILIAREAGRSTDLGQLDEIVAALPEGRRGYLSQTRRLREMVHEITTCSVRLNTVERPYLREPQAALLVKAIELFEQQVAGFHQPLAREFRAAARNWLEVARKQFSEAQAITSREPARQVFRAGDPVDRDQEAFVPRDRVFGELERQALLATGCPGLLLYGRRRTGKSTVLKNVASFLPPRVTVLSLSMQRAEAFISLPSWAGLLSRSVAETLPNLAPPGDSPTTLVELERYLGRLNAKLLAEDRRLILALDEYENLDRKIGEGVFAEDLLAVLRESIQSHRRLVWTFAGSHAIEELKHAEWTSYLVSVRTVEVPMFTLAETQLLLTEPLKYSALWKADDTARPRFEPGFWGEGGIEHIHREANGWPHLVQLLAERVVDRVNDTGAHRASPELLEESFDIAVERGHNTFYELMRKESTLPGEWAYLLGFKTADDQPPPADEAIAVSLRRRLLVSQNGDRWHLAVPLMQRWLRLRG